LIHNIFLKGIIIN